MIDFYVENALCSLLRLWRCSCKFKSCRIRYRGSFVNRCKFLQHDGEHVLKTKLFFYTALAYYNTGVVAVCTFKSRRISFFFIHNAPTNPCTLCGQQLFFLKLLRMYLCAIGVRRIRPQRFCPHFAPLKPAVLPPGGFAP
jgi:hypothetical protein